MKHKFIIFFMSCFFLLLGSCRKKAVWNTDWVVPLIRDTLVIKDYVNDSTLAINPDNSIQIKLHRTLTSLNLSELIEVPDTIIAQDFAISFNSFNVNPGYTFINQIEEHSFYFGEAVLVRARILSGKASIEIHNPVETKAIFTVALPGVTKNGQEFSYTKEVEGGTNQNPGVGYLDLDLSGYMIDLTGVSGNEFNVIQSKLIVKSDPEGPNVTIYNTDIFEVLVRFEHMKMDYAKGYFGNLVFEDTTEVELKAFQNITDGTINLQDLNIDVSIQNGLRVNAKGDISLLRSYNKNTQSIVDLQHPYFGNSLNINPCQGAWNTIQPSVLNFHFDASSGNLESFMENLGSKYELGYRIEMNPNGNTSGVNDFFYPKSKINIVLDANFPLQLGANELTLQDTFAIDFKNDDKLLRVKSGQWVLHTINSFPFGAKVQFIMLDDNGNVLSTVLAEGEIQPAPVNVTNNGAVPIKNKMVIPMTQKIVDNLPNTKSVVVRAVFNSTKWNNNVVYANAALLIKLQAFLTLKASL